MCQVSRIKIGIGEGGRFFQEGLNLIQNLVLTDIQEDVLILLDFEDHPVGLGDAGLKYLPAHAFNFFRVQGRVKGICLKQIELLQGPGLKGRG